MRDAFPLTIVTVVFNARDDFERTLQSLSNQKTDEVEYLVIDGASSDGTLELARTRSDVIDILVSEPDLGIYDAMNKGIAIARGDTIMFLNAGDTLTSVGLQTLLAAARTAFDITTHAVNVCQGSQSIKVYVPQRPPLNPDSQHMYWPHPGLAVKRRTFAKVGLFDNSLRFSADLDWTNRVMRDGSLQVNYSDQPVVNFEVGGASSTAASARESRDVAIHYGKSLMMAYARYLKIRARQWVLRINAKVCGYASVRRGSGSASQ
ncbi:MAG: glycosyltransferase family 2 protein [Gallionellaceae bacterium]